MAKNMPENQNGEEEVKEVRISREELKQARREAKAAKKAASEKEKLQKTPCCFNYFFYGKSYSVAKIKNVAFSAVL